MIALFVSKLAKDLQVTILCLSEDQSNMADVMEDGLNISIYYTHITVKK